MHIPVLLQEVIDGLLPQKGEMILDATVSGGGHSEALCRAIAGQGTILCLDEDEDALERSKTRLVAKHGCRFLFSLMNFRNLDVALDSFGIQKIDRALFDLGTSSFQLEESGRGFSFQKDEPLVMTFRKTTDGVTAREIVNKWEEQNIATILQSYGDERQASRIARGIIEARLVKPIETSRELAGIVERVLRRRGRIHPATKTFQALRIAVNDEFHALAEALPKAFERLKSGGRVAVISFHSMEDRVVKRFFKEKAVQEKGILITKKPLTPQDKEKAENPRSRSAKLRILEKRQ